MARLENSLLKEGTYPSASSSLLSSLEDILWLVGIIYIKIEQTGEERGGRGHTGLT